LNNDQTLDTHESSEEEEGLDIEEFHRLFNIIGLDDSTLVNKVFWIFDEDGSGDVDHKELAIGLEMLSKNSFSEKIGKFFDLCDDDGSGSINKKEFYSLLKLNLNDYEDKKRLKIYIKDIFREYDYDGDGELDKDEMIDACNGYW
jgi:Ca2+-binding EF-hand superfamily protein